MSRRWDNRAILAILAIAALPRVFFLNARPLWYDEAFSVLFSGKGLQAMLAGTLAPVNGAAADIHPLLYYSMLWGWIRLLGESPWAVRLLSVLFGLGTVAVVYFLGKALVGSRLAVFPALLVALSPFQVHYAQEIRMYALLAFLLALATWALWMGMHNTGWRWWVVFSLAAALAQYTHNLAAIYLLPLALTPLLARRWQALRRMALAGLGALLLYLPWLLNLPAQFAKVQQSYWTARPSPARLVTALLSYVTNLPLPDAWLTLALFATLFPVSLAAWQTLRAARLGLPTAKRGVWLAYLAFSPLLLLYLISQWQPVFIERALLPAGVMFLLWLGWALTGTSLPRLMQAVAWVLLLAGLGMGLYQHYAYRGFPYGPYAALDRALQERLSPGDIILHSNKLTMLPAVYYDRALAQQYLADPAGSGSDTLGLPTQKVLGLVADPTVEEAAGDARRVWLVIFSRAIEEYQSLGAGTHPHLAWLDEHFHRQQLESWDDLLLYEYTR